MSESERRTPIVPFDEWYFALKDVMRRNGFTDKSLATVLPEDWVSYYVDCYTPEDAFGEDMSYGH